jgi:hypothetical protein
LWRQIDDTTSTAADLRACVEIVAEDGGSTCAERFGWLANGSYGWGAYLAVRRLSPRSNRAMWLFVAVAALEYGLSRRHAAAAWGKLPDAARERIAAAAASELTDIDAAIVADARAWLRAAGVAWCITGKLPANAVRRG